MAVTITGIDELTARINSTHKSSPRTLDLAMNDTADAIMLKAMKEVPVLTGTLRQSIGADLSQTLHKIIFASADYASKIEYGEPEGGDPATQGERADPPGPRPYMRPAFQTEKKRINEFYEKRKG